MNYLAQYAQQYAMDLHAQRQGTDSEVLEDAEKIFQWFADNFKEQR